jgi:dihydropteroate synthase
LTKGRVLVSGASKKLQHETILLKVYLRPVGLCFGPDARAMIAKSVAGALGGMQNIAFTHIEIISRNSGEIDRRFESFKTWREHPTVRNIMMPRPDFAGLSMASTQVMGIVNVTPDSFSDGGRLAGDAAAIAHGIALAGEGASILDVGGESTRPGSDAVSVEEEIARVEAVISGLAGDHVVSVDTRKAAVMRAGLKAGARIVNDVSALRYDVESAQVVAKARAPVILMHAQGEPKTMQLNPRYDDVLLDVYDSLAERVEAAVAAGVAREQICIDPGIGFGKSFKQNLELMARLGLFHGLGVPVLVGLSRKGFVGAVSGENLAANRVHGSVGGALQAALQGAHILRVHDVKATVQALSMFTASLDPDSAEL